MYPARPMKPYISVIIPAFNEAASIASVLGDIPMDMVNEVIVVDNNSTDKTAEVAKANGATVLSETQQGYGFACLKGIDYLKEKETQPDIVVFLDADYSDYPAEISDVTKPIVQDGYDMVIGSRVSGDREKGSLTPQQVFGNWLATRLLHLFYGVRYTDLGPFRAIRFDKLLEIDMKDQTYGWTVEMQVKASKQKLKTCEVPVSYRKRIGESKISGTLKGSILAGYKILFTIFKYA